jgi:hypothetical protein
MLLEAGVPELGFDSGSGDRSHEVEIAGRIGAARVELDGTTTHQDGRRLALGLVQPLKPRDDRRGTVLAR